jgi:hypothetical protein
MKATKTTLFNRIPPPILNSIGRPAGIRHRISV